MAAVPANGDLLKIRFVCYTDTQIGINVTYWKVSNTVGTGVSDLDIAGFMSARVHAAYKALMSAQASFRGVGVQLFRPLPSADEVGVNLNDGNGGAGAGIAPTQTSGLISLASGLTAVLAARGRMYIPFPSVSDLLQTGAPTAGYVTRLSTLAGLLTGTHTITVGVNSSDIRQQVFHLATVAPRPVTADVFRQVNDYKISNRFATQRRRGQYGAQNIVPF